MSRLCLKVVNGVGIAKLTGGIATSPVMGDVYLQMLRLLDGEAPSIFMADMRAPTWAMSVQQLGAWFDGADASAYAPAALLVTPAAYDLFRAHAIDVAFQGIMRTVFTDADLAAEWVRVRQQVMRGHARPRESQRFPPVLR